MTAPIPLADAADAMIDRLATLTGAAAIAVLDGATLLGERAALSAFRIPGRIAAGGGCRLLDARDGQIALNLARTADRELLPALFADDMLDPSDEAGIAARVAERDALPLVARGRDMGLAIAAIHEPAPCATQAPADPASKPRRSGPRGLPPRILDLSALWAGPLATHLLGLCGAEVVKVESPARPDAMRDGQPDFHALLNQGKASVALDLRDGADRAAMLALIAGADIVVEAARPRALLQFGIDAAAIVAARPELVWIGITAHGRAGDAANWVGFGDDCGIAGGIGAAMLAATGQAGFVGDAIADPLTGIRAAIVAWEAWTGGVGGLHAVTMRDVAAAAFGHARTRDATALTQALRGWARAQGQPFPPVRRRDIRPARAFGADVPRWRERC